jgi:hypothetical protein
LATYLNTDMCILTVKSISWLKMQICKGKLKYASTSIVFSIYLCEKNLIVADCFIKFFWLKSKRSVWLSCKWKHMNPLSTFIHTSFHITDQINQTKHMFDIVYISDQNILVNLTGKGTVYHNSHGSLIHWTVKAYRTINHKSWWQPKTWNFQIYIDKTWCW